MIVTHSFEQFVRSLGDELLVTDIDQPSRILSALSDEELHEVCVNILTQFGRELVFGACSNSEWLDGKLVIQTNEELIHLFQVVQYATRLEIERRKSPRQRA
jgi:hypothetical protein